jgi:hypothetical protein
MFLSYFHVPPSLHNLLMTIYMDKYENYAIPLYLALLDEHSEMK